jgi:hypothetical protein
VTTQIRSKLMWRPAQMKVSFQVNPVGGEYLLNHKHPRPERVRANGDRAESDFGGLHGLKDHPTKPITASVAPISMLIHSHQSMSSFIHIDQYPHSFISINIFIHSHQSTSSFIHIDQHLHSFTAINIFIHSHQSMPSFIHINQPTTRDWIF